MKNLLSLIVCCFLCFQGLAQKQINAQWFSYCVIDSTDLMDTIHNRYAPTFYNDGLLFAQDVIEGRIGTGTQLMYAEFGDKVPFYRPRPLFEKTKAYKNIGPAAYSDSTSTVYFTANNQQIGQSNDEESFYKLSLYSFNIEQDKFKPNLLEFNHPNISCMHPTVNLEGDILIYSTDINPFYETDIFVSYNIEDNWMEPVNIDSININSVCRELFPHMVNDSTLIFASDRPGGFGKLDLYISKRVEGKWQEAKNLGEPFNSAEDDFALVLSPDKKSGYFSSRRSKSIDQIWKFKYVRSKNKPRERK